eukprot:765494-Hanusia_phi.AAC.6
MEMHHESKHPKVPWDASIYQNAHEMYGGTTKAGSYFRSSGAWNPQSGQSEEERAETGTGGTVIGDRAPSPSENFLHDACAHCHRQERVSMIMLRFSCRTGNFFRSEF